MIRVVYKCDRCGKATDIDAKEFRDGTFYRTKVGYTKCKGTYGGYNSRTIDVCEDCLNEFIEWMGVSENDT